MAELKVVVAGAGGRMGAANIRAVARHRELALHGAVANGGLALHAAVDRPGTSAIGQDAGLYAGIGALGITITDDIDAALVGADAIIDFTAPQASVALAGKAAERGFARSARRANSAARRRCAASPAPGPTSPTTSTSWPTT
jgi:4-hydroxy-tetrahydrodipicolinate reductase